MIQIRNNTFETNSSSAHTIAIKNHDEYDYSLKWLLNENGVFDFWCTSDLDFGRDFPTIYHLRAKLMTDGVSDIRLLFLGILHLAFLKSLELEKIYLYFHNHN